MPRKEQFYYVTWSSNVTRDVHWCVTVFYQPIENSNIANQIHGFTIDYGKFILISIISSQMSLTRQSIRIRWQQVTPLEQVHSQLVLVRFCNTTTNTHLHQARTNTFWAFIVIYSTSLSLVSFLDEHPIIQDTDLAEKHTSSTNRIHSSH